MRSATTLNLKKIHLLLLGSMNQAYFFSFRGRAQYGDLYFRQIAGCALDRGAHLYPHPAHS